VRSTLFPLFSHSTYTSKGFRLPEWRAVSRELSMPRTARRARTINATGTRRRGPVGLHVLLAWAVAFPAAGAAIAGEPRRAVEDLEAAGDAACERGWFTAARAAWTAAASQAATAALPETVDRLRHCLAMLDQLDQIEIEAEPVAIAPPGPREAERRPRNWTVRWSAALDRGGPASARTGDRVLPVMTRDLVLWNSGAAVHALAVADGLPPWIGPSGGGDGPAEGRRTEQRRNGDQRSADSAVFPRGVAATGDRAHDGPREICVAAGRGFAVIGTPPSIATGRGPTVLACLDTSAAAEGRLLWASDPPASSQASAGSAGIPDPAAFDGPPAADFECCAVAVRGPLGRLALAAFDARDGGLLWERPLGPSAAADGIDHARGDRSPCFAEEQIVIATHAGTVAAFFRDGRPAWKTGYATQVPPPARPATGRAQSSSMASMASPPVFSRGRIFVAPRDRGGVIALDVRTGAILWDAPGSVVDIVGTTARHVVVQAAGDAAEPGGGSAPAVRLLAAGTGRESARKAAGPGERPAGGGRLVGTMLFWPVHTGAPDRPVLRTLAVHVLDGDTLQPLAATTILPIGAPSAADDRETGDAEAVEIAVGSGVMLVASGRRIYCLDDGNRKAGPPSAE